MKEPLTSEEQVEVDRLVPFFVELIRNGDPAHIEVCGEEVELRFERYSTAYVVHDRMFLLSELLGKLSKLVDRCPAPNSAP